MDSDQRAKCFLALHDPESIVARILPGNIMIDPQVESISWQLCLQWSAVLIKKRPAGLADIHNNNPNDAGPDIKAYVCSDWLSPERPSGCNGCHLKARSFKLPYQTTRETIHLTASQLPSKFIRVDLL